MAVINKTRNANSGAAASAAAQSTEGNNDGGRLGTAVPTRAAIGPLPVSALAQALASNLTSQDGDQTQSQVQPGLEPGQTGSAEAQAPSGAADAGTDDAATGQSADETQGTTTEGTQETQETQATEGQEGQEPAEAGTTNLDQDTPGVKKRIRELQGQIQKLQGQLEEASSVAASAQAQAQARHPLSQVTNLGELAKREELAEIGIDETTTLLAKLQAAPSRVEQYLRHNGIVLKDEQGAEDYSPERMADYLAGAQSDFRRQLKAIPKRRDELSRYQQAYQEAHAQAVQVLPWINELGDERQAMMENVVRQFPSLKAQPNWEYWVGCAIEGHMGVKRRTARPATSVAAKSRPNTNANTTNGNGRNNTTLTSGGAGAARSPSRGGDAQKIAAAKDRVTKEGSRRALSAFFDTVGIGH